MDEPGPSIATSVRKRGTQCSAFGCAKRNYYYYSDDNHTRSDSEGCSDEETEFKKGLRRSFHG